MKILSEYTLDFIRRNKRSSLAVMVAILLSATMLSMLCGFFWNMWSDSIRLEMEYSGDWHGELYDDTLGSQLQTVQDFPSVETVMIKGGWQAAAIEDPRREYLIYRDANAAYWASMPERFEVMEGHIPQKSGELALSKQYFENHPELKIGDTLTLPVGDRMSKGELLDPRTPWQEGEQFVPRQNKTYTVVAKLDATTSSTVPGYTAIGFLEEADILPKDNLTVYLRFHNIRDTYKELPKLAQALGWQPDEYGNYLLRYNGKYLFKLLILPQGDWAITDWAVINMPLMFLLCGLMVVALFVMIIHNAFALSASSRLSQLGILASIGATPKQIRRSVIYEGLVLTAIPLPVGIALGWICHYGLVFLINSTYRPEDDPRLRVTFSYGFAAMVPAVVLALMTVYFSASIPAKRVSRLSPIEAIRQGEGIRLKKAPKPILGKLFGLEGELAGVSLAARKRAFRTATISLTLSVLLLTCILHITATRDGASAVYGTDQNADKRDIELRLSDGQLPDPAFLSQLANIEGVSTITSYADTYSSMWIDEAGQSAEFASTGGLAKVVSAHKYYPIERDGKYRVRSAIIGLDDTSFMRYCTELGIDPAPYYDTSAPRSIVYNLEEDVERTTRRSPVLTEYLELSAGDRLMLEERCYDDDVSEYSFTMTVGHLADRMPPVVGYYGRYTLEQVMPLSVMQTITAGFTEAGQIRAGKTNILLRCTDKTQVAAVREKLDGIVDRWYGSGDYDIVDINDIAENRAQSNYISNITVGFIVSLLAIIGLSNVWATISATLRSRRRELAMLRSMGLSPKGMKRMLACEAVLFSVTPLLLSLPVQGAILTIFIMINEITFLEYLPFAPILPTLLLMVCIFAVVTA
ncbi:MAG: FtsX-like permease family protein, partial [Angelakisella sp.]